MYGPSCTVRLVRPFDHELPRDDHRETVILGIGKVVVLACLLHFGFLVLGRRFCKESNNAAIQTKVWDETAVHSNLPCLENS